MFKNIGLLFTFICLLSFTCFSQKETIEFPSKDGLIISADVYMKYDKSHPFILLFHQAGWSRGEYNEIAPKLNALGFNCMAIDQRSGGAVNEVENQSVKRAEAKGLKTDFLDAIPDMLAAIEYAKAHFVEGKLILWGSSYSSALVLKIMGDHPDICDGGLSFSPGEYFVRFGQPEDFIQSSAQHITKPIFICSAHKEKEYWSDIFDAIPSKQKKAFLPETKGNHGSRALWQQFDDHQAYWQAVESFLMYFKK